MKKYYIWKIKMDSTGTVSFCNVLRSTKMICLLHVQGEFVLRLYFCAGIIMKDKANSFTSLK
jgi:hypothetical protein